MTNPGNIVRIRSRNAGRASVYEANMWAQTFSTGLLSGNGVLQNTSANMNVLVGGSPSKPDVVIAKNQAGYNIALDIIGQQAIQITPPASNSRIASIVAYTDDLALASTDTATTGSPSSCGLIVVYGSASATPTPPTEATIRSAITADGATGSQAVYGVIADIPVASSTTTITNALIGIKKAGVVAQNIDFTTFQSTRWSRGNQASITTTTVVRSVTMPVLAGRNYLVFGGTQQATPSGAGVWQANIRAAGVNITSRRLESTSGQIPSQIIGVYTATTNEDVVFDIQMQRITGTSGMTVEVADIGVVPVAG